MSVTTSPPLKGIKVVELGTLIAGPFCTRILAEFGAEVIKIESPDGGDQLRQWRKMYAGTSLWWYVQARNKKSITVNMRVAEGQKIVRRLCADADIVVENFRPGALEKWNLGFDQLAKVNPRLVMVRLSGYGQTGPYRDRPGFGVIGESMGGLRYVTGYADRPPVRLGISLGDSIAALYGVIGAMMAMHHRNVNGGRGQVVDVALYEAVFSTMESLVPEFDVLGFIRERAGNALPGIVPSNTYPTRDGKFVIIGPTTTRYSSVSWRPSAEKSSQTIRHLRPMQAALREQRSWTAQSLIGRAGMILTTSFACSSRRRCRQARFSISRTSCKTRTTSRAACSSSMPSLTASRWKLPGIVPKLSETPGATAWLGPASGRAQCRGPWSARL
jgi:formyl-CoA transferase